jgi:5-methyltetrahydrofolate--homocysteine methyltransferase
MRKPFLQALRERVLVQDGAKGTGLFARGLPVGHLPDAWNLENPQAVEAVHRSFVEAGADILVTNTFGSIRPILEQYQLADRVVEINRRAVELARAAGGDEIYVAASVPPVGHYLEPIGPLNFDEAVEAYTEQAQALQEAGVDVFNLETASDLRETKAAMLAIRSVSDKPVVAMMSFGDDDRTLLGTTPQAAAIVLQAMGADVIGANCSTGIQEIYRVLMAMSQVSGLPKIAQPNAGLPVQTEAGLTYPLGPEVYASYVERLIEIRTGILGGCCGTTPEHIRAVRQALDALGDRARPTHSEPWIAGGTTWLSSRTAHLGLGEEHPVAIIGERINPTRRQALAKAMLSRDMTPILAEAEAQARAGARLLDVNVGVGAHESPDLMIQAVRALEQVIPIPLVLDSADADVLAAGLRASAGKALVNSVSAEPARLDAILPVIKRAGAAVIGLCMDETGVPESSFGRVAAAERILKAARKHGIETRDVVIDPGLVSVAASPEQAQEVIEAITRLRERLKVNTCMGLSNISHGLPGRDGLNAAFLSMAVKAGLDAVILDPQQASTTNALAAAQVLTGRDPGALAYIAAARSLGGGVAGRDPDAESSDPLVAMRPALLRGDTPAVLRLVQVAVEQPVPVRTIVDDGLLPGMEELGRRFKARKVFLPQVMAAAEAMQAALAELQPLLERSGGKKGPLVVFATVEGDVHDIGKNIVAAMLRSASFRVNDLGKGVPAERIVQVAHDQKADLIGLSALMTTTMRRMEDAVGLVAEMQLGVPVMVGGAVVSDEYARSIGAEYAPDAVAAVDLARNLVAKSARK